ncbi:MAG: ArsR/SmtB family transcription factor [Gaiellales bacterium]
MAEPDAVFHALAHSVRRQMLARLATTQLAVGELAAPLEMSLAAASKHVAVLERAGLVSRIVDGRRHVCRLELEPLAWAAAWLAEFRPQPVDTPALPDSPPTVFRSGPVPDPAPIA